MFKKLLFTMCAALAMLNYASAQESPSMGIQPRVVKTTGNAEVKVAPNQATIYVGVEKINVSARAAKTAADAISREVLGTLRRNGIAEKDVQTAYLSLDPDYDWRSGKVTHFTAAQSFNITVRDISKLDQLLEALVTTGANRVGPVRYETSDLRKYKDQARNDAVKAAREKAEALAKALGQSIGKAYLIEEVQQQPHWGMPQMAMNTSRSSGDSGPTTAPGEISITASVTVWFELQ